MEQPTAEQRERLKAVLKAAHTFIRSQRTYNTLPGDNPESVFVKAALSRAFKDAEDFAVACREAWPICSVCGEEQFHTEGGWTCPNGHGGAPAKEE